MNHDEVVSRYVAQKANRQGRVEHRGSRMFCEGRAVYSFGHHFPLAYVVEADSNGGGVLFLKNGDRYSSTTSKHQGMIQRACPGPTVSFSALTAAGLDPSKITRENIVGWQPDTFTSLRRPDKDSPWQEYIETWERTPGGALLAGTQEEVLKPWVRPRQGMLILRTYGLEPGQPALEASWHVLGAVVLRESGVPVTRDVPLPELTPGTRLHDSGDVITAVKVKKDAAGQEYLSIDCDGYEARRYPGRPLANATETIRTGETREEFYLCSTDEGLYFVSLLPRPVTDTADAFLSLKPAEIQTAEEIGLDPIRQGEWFFVPTGLDDKGIKTLCGLASLKALHAVAKTKALPARENQTGRHICKHFTHAFPYFGENVETIFARSMVRHENGRFSRGRSSDHRAVRLGGLWFRAYRGLDVASWSMSGRFD